MNLRSEEKAEARFRTYVEGLASVLEHADRTGPLRDYCTGLILPGERKSVEPMAAKHQSLLHFVGVASWSDERVLAKVREMVLPAMTRQGCCTAASGQKRRWRRTRTTSGLLLTADVTTA